MDTGFDFAKIRQHLDRETWESDNENPDNEIRRVWLGTIFGITPSGKFYTPFACSNVAGDCDTCKGTGNTPTGVKRRIQKRHAKRHTRIMRRFDRLYSGNVAREWEQGKILGTDPRGLPSMGVKWRPTDKRAAFAFIDRQPKRYRLRYLSTGPSCGACDGTGSRSAALDARWNEEMEKAAESIGAFLDYQDESIFVAECRDACGSEDAKEDDANRWRRIVFRER